MVYIGKVCVEKLNVWYYDIAQSVSSYNVRKEIENLKGGFITKKKQKRKFNKCIEWKIFSSL